MSDINKQEINTVSGGQVAQHVHGNQVQNNFYTFKNKTLNYIFKSWHEARGIIVVPIFCIFNVLFILSIVGSIFGYKNNLIKLDNAVNLFIAATLSLIIFNVYAAIVYYLNKNQNKQLKDKIYIIPIFDLLLFYVILFWIF
ncbi:MAG: hypothetical protein AB7D96_07695 [Arcobacteraceae bacterium]